MKLDDENGVPQVSPPSRGGHLQKENIAVPWQLRMRIDDIELTVRSVSLPSFVSVSSSPIQSYRTVLCLKCVQLKQRKEKKELVKPQERKQASADSASNTNASTLKTARVAGGGNNNDDEKTNDPLLLLKAMVLPSVFMAVVAALVYCSISLHGLLLHKRS
jgi:hypothetical protein